MTLIQIPTEQTTAVTDLLICVLAIAGVTFLRRRGPLGLRGLLWRAVFQFLAIAGLLGGIAHGLLLDEKIYTVVWWGTYLALSLLIAAFFLATARDLWGDDIARALSMPTAIIAIGFFGYFILHPDSFLPFILYESAVMLFALMAFFWLTWQRRLQGSAWIAASIAVNIVAAIIQATGTVSFTVIWSFDHNGAFHLVQITGIALLLLGLRRTPA